MYNSTEDLVATSNEVVVTADESTWYDFTVSYEAVTASYWLGVIVDADTRIMIHPGESGNTYKAEDTYSDGPEATIGDKNVDYYTAKASIYATYYAGSDSTPPTYSGISHNTTIASTACLFSLTADDDLALDDNGQYQFATNNTGTWVWEDLANFTTTPETISTAKTLNSTVSMVVGYRWNITDNAENTNSTAIQTLTITAPSADPTYSSIGVNSTVAGSGIEFSCYVDDPDVLHPNGGFIFSTDNTGTWTNQSFSNFTATPEWANFSTTLNDTRALAIGYRWYINNTGGNEVATEIHYVLTTTYTTNLTRLHTDGTSLKNEAEETIHLEGTSLDPSMIAQKYCAWDRTMHEELMVEHGVEVMRLFICYGWWTGEYTEYGFPIEADVYIAGVDEIVANLTDNDIYVWICLEGSYSMQTEWGTDPATWIAWAEEIAYRYESLPNMMGIELHNEPALSYWSGNYYEHAEEVAEAIHDVDSTLITLIETGIHGWNNFDSNFPIDEPNTVYCHHMYYQWMSESLKSLYRDGDYEEGKAWLENYLLTQMYWVMDEDSGYVVFDTEFGVMQTDDFPAANVFLQDYIDIMTNYTVHWAYFHWDTGDEETYDMFKDDWENLTSHGEVVVSNYGDESNPTYYYLNITSATGGTTLPVAGEHPYLDGVYASVTAYEESGYSFANWTLDGGDGGTDNPTSVYMTANHTIQPYFVVNQSSPYDYSISFTNQIVYVQLTYNGTANPVPSENCTFGGSIVLTNSSGWAEFSLSGLSNFSYNSTAYPTDFPDNNMSIPLAKQTLTIQAINASNTISDLSYDSTQFSWSATGTGATSFKIYYSSTIYYITVNGEIKDEGDGWSKTGNIVTVTDNLGSTHGYAIYSVAEDAAASYGFTSPLFPYLLEGNFLGFILSTYTSTIGSVFYAISIFFVSAVIYIRQRSLFIVSVIWLFVGGSFIALFWEFSAVAVWFTLLGIAGLFAEFITVWRRGH